jgi:hypothetical protein
MVRKKSLRSQLYPTLRISTAVGSERKNPDDHQGTALLVRKHKCRVGQTDSRVSEIVTSEAGVVPIANTAPAMAAYTK